MKAPSPEIKAIQGILKGFVHSFSGGEDGCTLDAEQVNRLYILLKTAIQPI
jgi:hypothetical protein